MGSTPSTRRQRSYYLTKIGIQGKIEVTEYERLCREQNGVCAICGRPETASNSSRLSIDHCHKTGLIRGLLCSNCNTALGLFEDSEELLESALRYLRQEQHKEVELLPVGSSRPTIIQDDGEIYYTADEACSYLGVSKDTFNRLRKAGLLRRYRQGFGNTIYYRQSELDALRRSEIETLKEVELLSPGSSRPAIMRFDKETYYSSEEACNYLNISRETLNTMARDGRLHRCRQGFARTIYYRQSELDALRAMRLVE